ncbi:MAG: peptidylprolyl isomerase [Epsilonproteobacteria bacterium]|nr:peptidylprolyl isomerase [Campylobacterota bacterium]
MITWMQRHKKWLIITIWISTIAFVGAGFVGWGQYSYGDKAGSVAKVGDSEISMVEMQKAYSRLYAQYAQMFQGNFDEEKAKQFGLQKQALQQLIQQAYLINLAKSYDLSVSPKDIYTELQNNKAFFKDGIFDPQTYKDVLAQNRLTPTEYEKELSKELLVKKVLTLLKISPNKNEEKIMSTLFGIADKIEYKVLDPQKFAIKVKEDALKEFWENTKDNYMTAVSYKVALLKHQPQSNKYDQSAIASYYQENKNHFKDKEGKLLSLKDAQPAIIKELNTKANKKAALREFIAFKNGKTDPSKIKQLTISASNNQFNNEVFEKITHATPAKPFVKPVMFNGSYYSFQLLQTNPSVIKSFEEAKKELRAYYIQQKQKEKSYDIATKTVQHFTGKHSEFLTLQSNNTIDNLTQAETKEFLQKLFQSEQKRDFITLQSGKIVLFNILEQKLLENTNNDQAKELIARLKTSVFGEGLMKTLQSKYKTQIFIQGL